MLPTSLSFLALSSSSSCPVILPFDPLISSPSSRVPLFSFPAAHINLIRGPNTRASSLHSARKIKKRRYVAALKHRDEKTMISRGNRNRSSARDEDFKIDRDRFFMFRLMGEIWTRMRWLAALQRLRSRVSSAKDISRGERVRKSNFIVLVYLVS